MRAWRRTHLGTEADRATFRTLHRASLAAPALREGLTEDSAARSIRHLRSLLGTPAMALTDTASCLAWDGMGQHHEAQVATLVGSTLERGATRVFDRSDLGCDETGCPVRTAVVSPLVVEERIVGTLQAFAPYPTAGLARAADEVAQWVSGQLELAELDASRTRAIEAEVRALRAQISPHFIYNSLGAIASFVRTDPDRARDLLLEFADFTRYSFRSHGEYTTLAEELRSVERYLLLEQARFGERLQVTLSIAPEVLPVAVPFLCIQPLVENAVRHGLANVEGAGHVGIVALDRGQECMIEVEDDGVGEDPDKVRRALAGDVVLDSVGLGNVDSRLRNSFGDDYGLVVETAPGAGTKVIVRVPKFAPGVQA
ncbi:MAG: histidine kinase [Nocardioides sp.]|nr:histidine kinase [Nocardioides sp.]